MSSCGNIGDNSNLIALPKLIQKRFEKNIGDNWMGYLLLKENSYACSLFSLFFVK